MGEISHVASICISSGLGHAEDAVIVHTILIHRDRVSFVHHTSNSFTFLNVGAYGIGASCLISKHISRCNERSNDESRRCIMNN